MAERERVKKAIEAPVEEAAKLLGEARGEDVETRLAMLIDGWGRGLAAGLEEVAIAIGELRRSSSPDEPVAPSPSPPPVADVQERDAPPDPHEPRDEADQRDEDELRADAVRSREATSALREARESS